LSLIENPDAIDSRSDSKWPGWWKRRYEDEKLVKENPDNAKIVCFCEQITKGDIIRQIESPLKPRTIPLEGISKRGPGTEIAHTSTSNNSDEAKNEIN